VANELILIVEDDPKNLKLVRDTLQFKGYRTIDARAGEEGVQMAHDQQPALILMDIQLAGISGVEAFRQLRADPATRAIPVVAVTASERQNVIGAGFDAFQGKPISVRELLETVRGLLDRSAAA
jgi:two-component system cell cycle response regulator DivK